MWNDPLYVIFFFEGGEHIEKNHTEILACDVKWLWFTISESFDVITFEKKNYPSNPVIIDCYVLVVTSNHQFSTFLKLRMFLRNSVTITILSNIGMSGLSWNNYTFLLREYFS